MPLQFSGPLFSFWSWLFLFANFGEKHRPEFFPRFSNLTIPPTLSYFLQPSRFFFGSPLFELSLDAPKCHGSFRQTALSVSFDFLYGDDEIPKVFPSQTLPTPFCFFLFRAARKSPPPQRFDLQQEKPRQGKSVLPLGDLRNFFFFFIFHFPTLRPLSSFKGVFKTIHKRFLPILPWQVKT